MKIEQPNALIKELQIMSGGQARRCLEKKMEMLTNKQLKCEELKNVVRLPPSLKGGDPNLIREKCQEKGVCCVILDRECKYITTEEYDDSSDFGPANENSHEFSSQDSKDTDPQDD